MLSKHEQIWQTLLFHQLVSEWNALSVHGLRPFLVSGERDDYLMCYLLFQLAFQVHAHIDCEFVNISSMVRNI